MNFNNGPPYHNPPFNPQFGAYSSVFPGMMPPMSFAGGMPPMSVAGGIPPGQAIPVSYPPGQGPLAGKPAQRGANGLLESPELDGPAKHEAVQFVKLNPGEEVKYGEYWAQAVGEEENVGGKEAVTFLGRAKNVSKGQLRRIWDIADHRQEGFLGREEFYVALRLVALAQRGAELSVGGLRNFTGIQLIPDIAPEEKKEEQKQEAPKKSDAFSWTVPRAAVDKYDDLFKKLDSRNMGIIDGKQGVTFFGKSGLPRPTLKKIWDLSDVTRDGMLSLEEFRSAMHMVANMLNRKLTVTALPSVLDPNGPNWLRIEGEDGGDGMFDQLHENGDRGHSLPDSQPPADAPIVFAPPPPQPQLAPVSPEGERLQMPPPSYGQPQNVPFEQPVVQNEEADNMREALRKEKLEVERARREMEEMKAEMEKLRLEKDSLSKARAQIPPPVQPQIASPVPKPPTRLPYQNRSPPMTPLSSSIPAVPSSGAAAATSPPLASKSTPIVLGGPETPVIASKPAPVGVIRTEPINLGDEDDIWDQPSPKASALPGPTGGTVKGNMTVTSKDSVSSDEDDFWGALGTKPTLGPAGGQKPGDSKQGFGGSELDDWAF